MGWPPKHPDRVREQIRLKLLARNAQMREWTFYERIRVDLQSGCWIWTGAGKPYGVLRVTSRQVLAHRYSYEKRYGPIPAGLTIDHLCRRQLCVNPDHLEAVTNSENVRREADANRRHVCLYGHPYNELNTAYYMKRGVQRVRYCRPCARIQAHLNYAKRKGRLF